jgi:hypothetical protein
VEVTRKLHYRYLWIDLLCIVKDDILDWQREAANVGKIYRNANFNIAAGGSTDSFSPLCSERDASLIRPCKVELDWPEISGSIIPSYDREAA